MLPFGGDTKLTDNAQEALHFQLNFQTMHPNRSSTTEGLRTNTSLFPASEAIWKRGLIGLSDSATVG